MSKGMDSKKSREEETGQDRHRKTPREEGEKSRHLWPLITPFGSPDPGSCLALENSPQK